MQLDFHGVDEETKVNPDFGIDEKYTYVHPAIRDVLLSEPSVISSELLELYCKDVKNNEPLMVNIETFTIKWDVVDAFIEKAGTLETELPSKTISMEQLVVLASQCDLALFRQGKLANNFVDNLVPSPVSGLLRIIPTEFCSGDEDDKRDAHFYVTTLLALNMVENSIRHLIGKKNGRAPLLKDMVQMMAAREGKEALPISLISVLRTLLLPINGLNLRNLLWHGFLTAIPRRWLSLSVVLVLSLDELAGSCSFEVCSSEEKFKATAITTMREHQRLNNVLDHGKKLLSEPEELQLLERKIIESHIIPKSHEELLNLSFKFVHQPVVFASIVGPLIEHLLRLMWCDENKQNKRIAEPGTYYVTLDGHGQKDKHDVVIMPFLSNGERNKLVNRLGGPAMAFLMDMFTSPSGGPNIRATVAHGTFNSFLVKELISIEEIREGTMIKSDELQDMTSALLSVLSIICQAGRSDIDSIASHGKGSTVLGSYRPCFSYSSLLVAEVGNMIKELKSFHNFICDGRHLEYSRKASRGQMQIDLTQKLAGIAPSFEDIVAIQERILQKFVMYESNFTSESFYRESSNNRIASECGAARLLLSELSEAISLSLRDLIEGITVFESDEIEMSSRRRKQISRICATAQLALDFYSFAAYCALLYIEGCQNTTRGEKNESPTNDELFMAVKRSRMVVSTFSTTKTFDRALSALSQYTSGKAIKAIIQITSKSSI